MKETRLQMARPAVMLTLLITLLGRHGATDAAEITIFASRAMATMLERMGPELEEATGHTLRVMSGYGPEFVRHIQGGEPFDIVAVRAGSRKPDLSSVGAFKQALLDAKSVGYLPTAGAPQLPERLGVVQAVKAKAVVPATDTVCELVAQADVELGVVIVAQILTTPGVELAGPLPPGIQPIRANQRNCIALSNGRETRPCNGPQEGRPGTSRIRTIETCRTRLLCEQFASPRVSVA